MGVAPKARLDAEASVTGLSHDLWMLIIPPKGASEEPEQEFQRLSASSWWGQVTEKDVGGSRTGTMEEVPSVEAKKAEGASMITLLIPNPPK